MMKITLAKGSYDTAPKQFVRVALTIDAPGHRAILKEGESKTLEIGVGMPGELTVRKLRLLCRAIVNVANAHKVTKLALELGRTPQFFTHLREQVSPEQMAELATENFILANYEHTTFKTRPKDGWSRVEEIRVYSPNDVATGVTKGQLVAEAVNACRELANTPGGDMTPAILAKAARSAVTGLPVKVTVLGENEMKKLGMGAVLGVAKGSSEKPQFIILEYRARETRPVVLVGKGVTFDSGGLNLKPSASIYEMHMDMSGGAAVIHAVALAARLKLPQSVVGLIPAVENMPGNNAVRPGDVVKTLSGKTIEILDTDAEGRVILADALTYAKRFSPRAVIDIATLTGAAVTALGLHASALLTRDDAFAHALESSGEASGDYVWRLPLWDEYEERVKGTFADLKNVPGGSTSRYGGAIDGAMFLWQFAKELDCPWAHLDIAPRMTSAPGDELAKGAAGEPVRLLLHYLIHAVHDKN